MKQTDLGLNLSMRRTRKQILLDEMEQVMPWGQSPHISLTPEVERLCSHGQMLLWGETAQGHVQSDCSLRMAIPVLLVQH